MPLPGLGCARPRLHLMGANGPLLASGGRGVNGTTEGTVGYPNDLFLWVSRDGMGLEWEKFSLTYLHNSLLPPKLARRPSSPSYGSLMLGNAHARKSPPHRRHTMLSTREFIPNAADCIQVPWESRSDGMARTKASQKPICDFCSRGGLTKL